MAKTRKLRSGFLQVAIGDNHIPDDCPRLRHKSIACVKAINPSRVDHVGDLVNFASLSAKYPILSRNLRLQRVVNELASARRYLKELREAVPNAEIVFHQGNHEHRLEKYLSTKAPALVGLAALDLPSLLSLEELEIGYRKYGQVAKVGSLLVTHGSRVRASSGASAMALIDRYGMSVLCGHTHRGGVVYRTLGRRVLTGIENFCLCGPQEYELDSMPNWQNGLTVVDHYRDKFVVEQIRLDGQARWRGKALG